MRSFNSHSSDYPSTAPLRRQPSLPLDALARHGIDHREVSQLALQHRLLVDVLVPAGNGTVHPSRYRDGIADHLDIAPEFAVDVVGNVAEIASARAVIRLNV